MLLKTNKKIQKTHRCEYVLLFLEKETDKKIVKRGVDYLKTYGSRVKTLISENQNKSRKPQLLLEEQVKEVTNVVQNNWQPYIAKYP